MHYASPRCGQRAEMNKPKIKINRSELIYQPVFEKAPSCHASTIVKMKDGRPAAAWFAGTCERHPDVRIWNPTLFCDESSGRLILVYKSGLMVSKWRSMVMYSYDNGKTWTEPEELVKGDKMPRGPVKNKMVRLSNGRLLAPASDEIDEGGWGAFFDISDDNGKTWTRTKHLAITLPGEDRIIQFPEDTPYDSYGLIQPTVWEFPQGSGKVHMFARSSFGWIYRASSDDYGLTWSVARPTSIPNNNSGIDAVMTPDGILALVYNPVGRDWGPRYPIAFGISTDNGETFCDYMELDTKEGEYSYPAIICDGAKLHITYTYNRVSIKYVEAEII
jgi:predicted neuraminidase